MLSPHFSVSEFTDSQTAARQGLHNTPRRDSPEWKNLERLAETMERVRTILGDRPVLISSGFRAPEVNKAVGGSKTSAHMGGLAADFTCPGFGPPLGICKALQPNMAALFIDQLIYEFGTWVHLGLRPTDLTPRHQALTIDIKGTRLGFHPCR